MKKNFKLKPSLNKTKKKEKYTSAVPVSPWNRIKIKGIRIKVETLIKDFILSTFKFEESKTFARINAVENLANSDGWNFKPKKLNHETELFTSWPKSRTKTKRIIDKKYKGTAKSNINLYSIICMTKKIIKQIKIHISCLNDSFFNETKGNSSEYWDE